MMGAGDIWIQIPVQLQNHFAPRCALAGDLLFTSAWRV